MPMRVCYFYAESFPKAVRALPANVEMVDTSGSMTAYWDALLSRWNKGDDLVTIEQDNVIAPDAIASFGACDEIWCSYAYMLGLPLPNPLTELVVPWGVIRTSDSSLTAAPGMPAITASKQVPDYADCINSLGCTKFSAEMQERFPLEYALSYFNYLCPVCDSEENIGKALCWQHIDAPIVALFQALGIGDIHVHGEIEHLHFLGPEARL